MRYKIAKKISNLSSPDTFFQAQNAPKSVPPPHCPPHSSPPASRTRHLRRLGSQAPLNTKSWLRHCWQLIS